METFKRKIWDKFKAWKEESDGHTALLVEGARRIGKSTAVEEFAKREYESYILIDFAFASQNIKNLFNDLSDLNSFFRLLLLVFQTINFSHNIRFCLRFTIESSCSFSRLMICQLSSQS